MAPHNVIDAGPRLSQSYSGTGSGTLQIDMSEVAGSGFIFNSIFVDMYSGIMHYWAARQAG